MAVVTLKDLMDPLTKLVAATEKNSQKLDSFISSMGGGSGASLNKEVIKELQIQTNLLKVIAGNTKGGGGSNDGGGGKPSRLKDGGDALKLLGASAKELAIGLIIFRFVSKKAISTFLDVIREVFKVFEELPDMKDIEKKTKSLSLMGASIESFARNLAASFLKLIPGALAARIFIAVIGILMPTFQMLGDSERNIDKGAETLGVMGRSLGSFAKGLVLAAIGSAVGILFTPVIVLAMIILGGAFALLGRFDKFINSGARTLGIMGRSLIMFSIGLVTFALASLFILMEPKILMAMVGSLVLIGGAFALLGVFDKSIRKGAAAIFFMSIGLVFFSIAYAIFSLVTKNITAGDIGIQAGILLGLGISVGILGGFVMNLIKGAIAVAAMGIGLMIFSLGYLPFAMVTKDMTIDDVATQAGILLALGLEFAAAGVGSLFILAGAAAYAAVGLALLVLAPGLLAIKKVNFTEEDSLKLVTMLSGVKSAFLGGKDSDEGFFAKVGGAITGAVDSVRMLEAAAGFAAAGVALKLLAFGLTAIKKVDFTQEDTLKLTTMLNGVTTAFALAGSEKQVPSTSFFGQMFGFKRSSVEEGIMSVMSAGKALTSITKGLISFQELIDKNVDFVKLGESVSHTVGFIQKSFAAVAGEGNVEAGGFFNTLFGIKKNKVAEGIDSVMDAGKALTSIAEGLISFQGLIDNKVDFVKLGVAVSHTVGFIQEAFAAVAEEGNVQAGGFFNTLFGIKKNKVAEGIDSVKGAGKELTNIATGLKSFQELVDKDINWANLGDVVSKALGFVGTAFAQIGGMESEDSTGLSRLFGISWDENSVKKGVDAVQGAGKELMNIAKGLKTFQNMIDKDVDFTKLGKAVKKSLMFVGDAFAQIGGKEETDSALFGLIKWDENLINKGIKNVKGAGAELTNIAKGLKSFSELKDPKVIANSIKSIFTSIGNTFTFYYEKPKFKSQLDHMKGFISEISYNAKNGYIDKAAKGMDSIAKAVNSIDKNKAESFANLFKGAGELTDNKDAFNSLLQAVKEIRDALATAAAPAAPAAGTTGTAAGPTSPTGPGLQTTLNDISKTLQSLNTTMSGLPDSISMIKFKPAGQ
jgi:hypothetical protein